MPRSLLLIFGWILYSFSLSAQPILSKTMDIAFQEKTIKEALVIIQEEANVNFTYSPEILPSSRISLLLENASLNETLEKLFQNTRIDYKVIGGQIVLFEKDIPVRKFTISGYIQDKETGELLVGANVVLKGKPIGTSANAYGFFSLELQEGEHELIYSYSGYQPETKKIDLNKNKNLQVQLEGSLTLKEVVVLGSQQKINKTDAVTRLTNQDLERITSLGGEKDLFRMVNLLPGVFTGTDGVGGVNVRGGSIDQNLFLLDDVTIYNPTHLIGAFAIFNEEAIKSVDFIKGRFPAKYGGRLSSVMDIRTKDGNVHKWKTTFGAGLSTLKFSTEGPLVKGKSAIFLAGRTTPLSFIVEPLSRANKERNSKVGFTKLNFFDVNAKIHYRFSDRNTLYLSYYRGGDTYRDENSVIYTSTLGEDILHNRDASTDDIRWGNSAGGLRWNHVFGKKLFLNSSLTYSRYDFQSEASGLHIDTLLSNQSIFSLIQLRKFSSEIKDLGAKMDFEWTVSPSSSLLFGAATARHRFTPGVSSQTGVVELEIDQFELEQNFFDSIENETVKAASYAMYLSHELKLEKFRATIGVHWSALSVDETFYHAFLPRLDFAYHPFRLIQFTGGFSKTQQFLHLLTTSGVGLPTDLWIPSTSDLEPECATQYNLGLKIGNENLSFGIEGYDKKMNNLIEYSQNASFNFIDSENYLSNIIVGEGESKGLEFLLAHQSSRWTSSVAYTLSKTDRTFSELNNGATFPFRYDRTHNLKLLGAYQINQQWSISGTFIYGTGLAISLPSGRYNYYQPSSFQQPVEVLIYSERNGFRLPPNHRLDLACTWEKTGKKLEQKINFGIYNLYNRKNALYYRLGRNPDKPSEPAFLKASLVPVLPYLHYTIKF